MRSVIQFRFASNDKLLFLTANQSFIILIRVCNVFRDPVDG